MPSAAPSPSRPLPPRYRRAAVVALALLVGAALQWLFPPPAGPARPTSPTGQTHPTEIPVSDPADPAAPLATETRVYLGPGSPLAPELNAPGGSGVRDVEILRQITGAMLSSLKGGARPPLGDNLDFARALRGQNKLGVVLLPPRHPAFAADGRLVDRWGSPYHFHPVASDFVEVRSAGPDRVLFTEDDVQDAKSLKKNAHRRE